MATGPRFSFASFELDAPRRRLTRSGEPLAISERQLDVLILLVSRAGQVIAKDELLQAGWKDVAVGDNSIEQAVSSLRRILGTDPQGATYIETVPRRGYRFTVAVSRLTTRESDAGLDALLAPHRAFIEGRAALETLAGDQIARARTVFERAVSDVPESAPAHVGLANASIMQFEMTRADPSPDRAALGLAVIHAREACRLDPQSGEAWATLGFVLDRAGEALDAGAAARRAVALEPSNWRHHFRLAYVSWGEERLRAAHQTLALLPGFALAHWLAATVHVARQVMGEAERELMAGLAAEADEPADRPRFPAVALHWLLGLIHLSRGHVIHALDEFERELVLEPAGQLYARECAANTWYAIGAVRLGQHHLEDARAAFARAIERVATHPLAHVGLAALSAEAGPPSASSLVAQGSRRLAPGDAAVCKAVGLVVARRHGEAAEVVERALATAPPGNAAWILPLEPLLRVGASPEVWARALARLRNRAA